MIWHVITPEYPPESGGVSDYVHQLSEVLGRSGDDVHVWCPSAEGVVPEAPGVTVHHELGCMNIPDLLRLGEALDCFPKPRKIFMHWVPHGYRRRSMNIPFCVWLWSRAVFHGDSVEMMVHEAFLPFRRGSWRQNAAAVVHRVMMVILLQAVRRVWVSIPAIVGLCRPYAMGRSIEFHWLPLPSNVPVRATSQGIEEVRRRYRLGKQLIVGHFGTFGASIVCLLEAVLPGLLLACPSASLLLIGRGGCAFRQRLLETYPEFTRRVQTTGFVDSVESLSCLFGACDLMIQPYPDGVTTRRTSLMAPLAHARPVVTTSGSSTEEFWSRSGAVALAPVDAPRMLVNVAHELLINEEARNRMGLAASALYSQRFDIERTTRTFREAHVLHG